MFSSKLPKKSSKKILPFNVQLLVNNCSFFDWKIGKCYVRVFPLLNLVLFDFAEILTRWSWIDKEQIFPLPMCGTHSRWRDISLRSQGFEEIDLRSVTLVWLYNPKFLLILKKTITERLLFSTIKTNINFLYVSNSISCEKGLFLTSAGF